jgi:hypothetical protein
MVGSMVVKEVKKLEKSLIPNGRIIPAEWTVNLNATGAIVPHDIVPHDKESSRIFIIDD